MKPNHLLHACLLICLAPPVAAQSDWYVHPVLGSDFDPGSCTEPFQTVSYALTVAAPGDTVWLQGTLAGSYAAPSESFPWVLQDVSLAASPCGGTGSIVEVDGANIPGPLVVLDGSADFSARIEGITFLDADLGIELLGGSGQYAPQILDCTFFDVELAAQMESGLNSRFNPVFRNNQVGGAKDGLCHLKVTQALEASPLIEDNFIGGDDTTGNMIRLEGTTQGGHAVIQRNQGSRPVNSDASIIQIWEFNGRVDILKNSGAHYRGLEIFNCPWHPESRVEENDFNSGVTGIRVTNTSGVTLYNNKTNGNHQGVWILTDSDEVTVEAHSATNNHTRSESAGIRISSGCEGYRVLNCTLDDNLQGITVASANGLIEGCDIINNDHHGIRAFSGAVGSEIARNLITHNDAGGIRVDSTSLCVVANEIAYNGFGIRDSAGDGNLFASNLIHHNNQEGFLLRIASALNPPQIVHNTVADNSGYGLDSDWAGSSPFVANSIFWNNNGSGDDVFGLMPGEIIFSDVEQGAPAGTGNFSLDPLFEIPGSDYCLSSASPCLEAGDDSWALASIDLKGDPRNSDADWDGDPQPDCGSDERVNVALKHLSGEFSLGSTLNLEIEATDQPTANYFLYAAVDPDAKPLAAKPGGFHPLFGTVLLDQNAPIFQLVESGSLVLGEVSISATIPPAPSLLNQFLALEAGVGGFGIGAGQLSSAICEQIKP